MDFIITSNHGVAHTFAIRLIDAVTSSNNKCDIACIIYTIKIGIIVFSDLIIWESWGNNSTIHIPTNDFHEREFSFVYPQLCHCCRRIARFTWDCTGSLTTVTHVSFSVQGGTRSRTISLNYKCYRINVETDIDSFALRRRYF